MDRSRARGSDDPVADGLTHDDPAGAALRRHATRVRARELERAFTRLDAAEGDLTPDQRETVRQLAARLVDGMVAPAASALAAGDVDPDAAATLFEP